MLTLKGKKLKDHMTALGRISTRKKAESSRRNGMLGGRPRKNPDATTPKRSP